MKAVRSSEVTGQRAESDRDDVDASVPSVAAEEDDDDGRASRRILLKSLRSSVVRVGTWCVVSTSEEELESEDGT